MGRPITCHNIDADPSAAPHEDETARLPALSLEANAEDKTPVTDEIIAKLDELITLSRSTNDHLESLVGKHKAPAWAPKKKNGA